VRLFSSEGRANRFLASRLSQEKAALMELRTRVEPRARVEPQVWVSCPGGAASRYSHQSLRAALQLPDSYALLVARQYQLHQW